MRAEMVLAPVDEIPDMTLSEFAAHLPRISHHDPGEICGVDILGAPNRSLALPG